MGIFFYLILYSHEITVQNNLFKESFFFFFKLLVGKYLDSYQEGYFIKKYFSFQKKMINWLEGEILMTDSKLPPLPPKVRMQKFYYFCCCHFFFFLSCWWIAQQKTVVKEIPHNRKLTTLVKGQLKLVRRLCVW